MIAHVERMLAQSKEAVTEQTRGAIGRTRIKVG